MPTYRTFGDGEPAPSADTAKLRAEWHTQQITAPIHKLVEHAAVESEHNEAAMKPIYRKLSQEAVRQQGKNTKDMAAIIAKIGDALRSQIVSNQAALSAIVALTGGPPADQGGGIPDEANCPPGSQRVAGLCVPSPPAPPARGGGRIPPPPPPAPGPGHGPPVVPPPPGGTGCGPDGTDPCLPPEPIQCPPGHIPVIVGGVVVGCLPPCPVGYHYEYLPGNPYPHCVRNPPPPPPCVGDNCGLGCGPVGCCDVHSLGTAHSICDPVGNLVVKAAQSMHVPSELWGPDPSGGITSGPYALYIGARPPIGHPPMRLSGPAPLADILHGSVPILPPNAVVKTYVYADDTPPPLGTVCPGGGGPCPEAKCPDGFHWEQQSDGAWKCVPDRKRTDCTDFLKHGFTRLRIDDKNLGATLVNYTQIFGELGDVVQDAFDHAYNAADLLLNLIDLLGKIPVIGQVLADILTPGVSLAAFANDLRCTLGGLSLVGQIWGQKLLLGLYFAKAVISAFHNVRIGFDLAAWITTDISFEIKELDELVQYLINRITQMELPTSHEALRLFYAEKWPEDWAHSIVNMNGQSWQIAHDIYHAERERITPLESVMFGFRQGWKDDTIAERLYTYGLTSRDDVDDMIEMAKEVPPPSDVIHFVVREAFNINKLGRDEMIKELDQEPGFRDLARAVGLTKINVGDDNGKMTEYDVPLLHWLAHYQEISPTQGYDMVHRLRPDRVKHFRTFVPNQTPEQLKVWIPIADFEQSFDPAGTWVTPKPFTSDILARLLKQLEYNPLWRAGLEAISYHVLTRVDVRRMYGTGTFGDPHGVDGFERTDEGGWKATRDTEIELVNRYMDQGYTREDAGLLGYFTAKLYDDTSKKIDKRWFKDICTAYSLGTVSYEDSLQEFKRVLNDDQEAAQKALDLCDFEATIRVVMTAVKAIRTGYMRGEYDDNHARAELYNIGIVKKRNDQYLQLWRLELAAQSKQATASMMCQWYGDGSISLDDMYTRLTNVGFKDADARRIVNHCQIGVLAKTAAERDKAIKAALAEQRRIQAAEDRAKAKAEADAKSRLAKFLSAFTDKHIKDWWSDGLIGRDEVASALRLKGWGEDQVREYIAEYLK